MATSKKSDDKVAGTDQSKNLQTTDQAEERKDATPEKVEERGDTNAEGAAKGTHLGAVKDGQTNLVPEDKKKDADFDVKAFTDGKVEGATGTVAERNLDGDEFDVPYVYLTAADLPRTSDSDDPVKDWTAQHATGEREDEDGNEVAVALVPVENIPGQTFRVRELPNRDVVEKAGIDYDQWVAGLPVRADVPNEAPRKGVPA